MTFAVPNIKVAWENGPRRSASKVSGSRRFFLRGPAWSASSAAIASWIFASRFSLSLAQSGISSPRLSSPKGHPPPRRPPACKRPRLSIPPRVSSCVHKHEVVRPMLADRKGWATFIGTPKGKNEFWKIYNDAKKDPAWFHMILRASESRIIAPSELTDLRREMGEDQYQQEFECSFEEAIKGAFYAEEMRSMLAEGRICPIEINKDVMTHTAWDLGVSDSTAIWFIQCVGRERRLVDYYEASGVGLDHYAQVLHDKRIQHGWKYGEHYFPHDIKHRELTTGRSRLQALNVLGIDAVVVPETSVLDGVNVVRRMFGRTWIEVNRCERGIEALRQYRREYDDKLKDWRKNPLHDWTSHGADALRTRTTCGGVRMSSQISSRKRAHTTASHLRSRSAIRTAPISLPCCCFSRQRSRVRSC